MGYSNKRRKRARRKACIRYGTGDAKTTVRPLDGGTAPEAASRGVRAVVMALVSLSTNASSLLSPAGSQWLPMKRLLMGSKCLQAADGSAPIVRGRGSVNSSPKGRAPFLHVSFCSIESPKRRPTCDWPTLEWSKQPMSTAALLKWAGPPDKQQGSLHAWHIEAALRSRCSARFDTLEASTRYTAHCHKSHRSCRLLPGPSETTVVIFYGRRIYVKPARESVSV
jgi:hypothetical protein